MGEAARRAAAEHEPNCWPAALDVDMTGVNRFAPNVDRTHRILAFLFLNALMHDANAFPPRPNHRIE